MVGMVCAFDWCVFGDCCSVDRDCSIIELDMHFRNSVLH